MKPCQTELFKGPTIRRSARVILEKFNQWIIQTWCGFLAMMMDTNSKTDLTLALEGVLKALR